MNYRYFAIPNYKDIRITHIRERYSSTPAGNYKRKPDKTEIEIVSTEFYNNFVQAIPFFKSRAFYSYTPAGYIPTRITTVSPDRYTKYVDKFEFTIER